MKVIPHWDWLSMLLYIFMGVLCTMCIVYVNKRCVFIRSTIKSRCSIAYFVWLVIWVVFATWRYVASGIGGMDASAYIQYFDVCLNPGDYWYAEHVDILYRILNKSIRIFTDDYHVLFIVIYSFIVISYIYFIEKFRFSRMSYIPFILIVYIYIRGFCTIRTNMSAGCVLISYVFMRKNKYSKALIFALISVLFQVASIVYAGFLLFYFLYKKRNISIEKCIAWIFVATAVGKLGQYIIANYELPFLSHGAYRWYAVYSQAGQTFFTNYWKISFSQILLGVVMAIFWKPLSKDIESRPENERNRLEYLRLICIYDIILIPITYILNIWRGYEYLYIARLVMWAELIPVICSSIRPTARGVMRVGFIFAFIGWMVFRQYNTWEDSGLMPYVFAPLMD